MASDLPSSARGGYRRCVPSRRSPTARDVAAARLILLDGLASNVDLLDEVAWWQTDDFWCYAAYAAVAYIRLAADRAGVPASEVCRALAGGLPASPE